MKTLKMNLSELKFPERNVRKHPPKQINEMKRSIKMFGQFRPIVVDETNTILAGNGLVMAMQEMGYTEADVLKYENLTESQKKKLMIADNQVASMGVDDFDTIEQFIRELDDLDVPGYDEKSLEVLIADSEEVTESVMNYGVFPQEEIQQVKKNEGIEQKPVEQTYEQTQSRSVVNSYDSRQQNEEQMETSYAETQRYVICPHCGEKIYLE